MKKEYSFSDTGINAFLADYVLEAEKQSGDHRIATSVCNALCDYVLTGKASLDFERAMLLCKPFELASESLRGGSDEQIIRRLKAYIKRQSKKEAV